MNEITKGGKSNDKTEKNEEAENKDNQTSNKRKHDELDSGVIEGDSILPVSKNLNERQRDKLMELRQKINEAKKLNAGAVLEEEKMATDPNYEKNKRKEEGKLKTKQYEEVSLI